MYILTTLEFPKTRLPLDVSLLSPVNVSMSVDDHCIALWSFAMSFAIRELARANIQRAQQRMKDY